LRTHPVEPSLCKAILRLLQVSNAGNRKKVDIAERIYHRSNYTCSIFRLTSSVQLTFRWFFYAWSTRPLRAYSYEMCCNALSGTSLICRSTPRPNTYYHKKKS